MRVLDAPATSFRNAQIVLARQAPNAQVEGRYWQGATENPLRGAVQGAVRIFSCADAVLNLGALRRCCTDSALCDPRKSPIPARLAVSLMHKTHDYDRPHVTLHIFTKCFGHGCLELVLMASVLPWTTSQAGFVIIMQISKLRSHDAVT